MSGVSPRNVRIGRRRTSMRLEAEFWSALAEMADRKGTTAAMLCTEIARRRGNYGLSAAVRVEVLNFFRSTFHESAPVRPRKQKTGSRISSSRA
ncbi:MAG TPA: ribbon-helix-helix domain-containing protein [Alphaproteobacteria bacterium]|nr:ribbon-helix-helix domain-containing protein [Alphaproteobacteria bacterium]